MRWVRHLVLFDAYDDKAEVDEIWADGPAVIPELAKRIMHINDDWSSTPITAVEAATFAVDGGTLTFNKSAQFRQTLTLTRKPIYTTCTEAYS